MTHEAPLPRQLASRRLRVVRPRDAAQIYKAAKVEFARLAEAGLIIRLAHGYYAIPPTEAYGDPGWTPTVEDVAMGIGVADYGPEASALSGVSAARHHGAMPRALSVGVVSVPVRRSPLITAAGRVVFWTRRTDHLDTVRAKTELAWGYTTSTEQTLLDLANRPRLGGVSPRSISEAIWALAGRADWDRTHRLSVDQQRPSAYARVIWVCAGLAPTDAPPAGPRRSPTKTLGLSSWGEASPAEFGLTP
ncbi:MAG: type IV toxin-antitoxin system AbiEi family antitoxin domain-containing protein [Acidimicrobiia bacterium]